MANKRKDVRLTARVDEATQQYIAQAAELSGMTVSQFLIDAAREEAAKLIEQMTRIQVSTEAANRMMQALDEPSEPNALLKRVLTKRQELITSDGKFYPNR